MEICLSCKGYTCSHTRVIFRDSKDICQQSVTRPFFFSECLANRMPRPCFFFFFFFRQGAKWSRTRTQAGKKFREQVRDCVFFCCFFFRCFFFCCWCFSGHVWHCNGERILSSFCTSNAKFGFTSVRVQLQSLDVSTCNIYSRQSTEFT